MATRGIEPITLPWKRPEKGVSAAELGASFRVEQREDGWHCTVRVGRRAEVLATGLRRLRDAQCRAEAHAATLPEVAAALAKLEAEAAKPAKKGPVRGTARAETPEPAPAAAEDVPRPVPKPRRAAPPTFEQVSDGCICGKIDGGTWIADPAGKVSVPAGTDPELAQEICRVASKHYAAQREKTAPPSGRIAQPVSRVAAKRGARPAADASPASTRKSPVAEAAPAPRRASTGKRSKSKTARKRLAAKLAAKPGARMAAKTAAEPATETSARTAARPTARAAKKTTARAAKKTTARAAKKTTARAAKTTTTQTTARTVVQVAATDPAPGARGRRRKDDTAPAVAQAETKEAPLGKKSGKASKSGSCGCMTWTETEGKARGEAKHGAFVIEPEGKKHALYFYDPDGQSRHLQSGEPGKLRKVAEEMAARGQPAARTAGGGDDAALLKMFMAGAMEEET
jgi:hypothetical protein